jgi:ABC-type glycerol-3-phosphate transport system permease component
MTIRPVTETRPYVTPAGAIQRWLRLHGQTILTYTAFALFVLVIGFPFYYILISSFTPRTELFQIPPSYMPDNPTLDNYQGMMDAIPFLTYYRNSLIFGLSTAFVSVVVSAMAAYALARIHFPGSNIVYLVLILSVALPQVGLLVPIFEIFQTFDLVNTHRGLTLLMSSLILPFTILTLVSFIQQIPSEVEEAALIDGASIRQTLMYITFPLIRPALATMFMINFIIAWNELLYPLVFAQRIETKPLSVGLVELSSDASTFTRPWDLMSAMSIMIVIPVLLLVLFGQRMIIAGLSRGAIKG